MRSLRLVVVVVAALAVVPGCKKDKPVEAAPGGGSAGGVKPGTGTAPPPVAAPANTGPTAAAKGPEGCNSDLSQALVGDTTLTEKCSPYTASADFTADVNLTIEPGVELRFKEGTQFNVAYGGLARLTAKGTAEKPIRFVALAKKEPGSWKGVHLYSKADGSVLENVVIEHGGDLGTAALDVEGSGVSLKGVKIVGTKKQALLVRGELPAVELSGLDLTPAGGDPDELVVVQAQNLGALGANNHFPEKGVINVKENVGNEVQVSPQGVPYRFLGEIYIEAKEGKTASMTIQAGTTVQMSESAAIYVGYGSAGGLKIKGTAEKPVVLARYGEDAKTTPWKGLTFYSHARAPELEYATFEYAGTSSTSALRYDDVASLGTISHCTFRHIPVTAVLVASAKERFATFDGNTFDDVQGPALDVPVEVAHGLGATNTFGPQGYVLLKGSAQRDTQLKALGAPYHVEGELQVNGPDGSKSATLTLDPGVTLLFNDQGKLSVGYGAAAKLVAKGTAEKPITLSASGEHWSGVAGYAHGTLELERVVVSKTGDDDYAITMEGETRGSAKDVTFQETKRGLHKCNPKFTTSGLKADKDVAPEDTCG